MIVTTALVFLCFLGQGQGQEFFWEEPILLPTTEAQVTFRDSNLYIPEYPITDSRTVVAKLKYNTKKKLTIECVGTYCVRGLLNTTFTIIDDTTADLYIFGLLDFDDGEQPKSLEYHLFLDVNSWGNVDEENGRRLTVNLQNVNDKVPNFVDSDIMGKTFNLTEREDVPAIYTMSAVDNESNKKNLNLEIIDTYDDVFYLTNSATNEWTIGVQNLDYDLGLKTYSVDLKLSRAPDEFDNENSRTVTLIFKVIDVPDQSPQWQIPCSYVEKPEDTPADTVFWDIKAIDVDNGVKSKITYTLGDDTLFYIESFPDGKANILNQKMIDRDTMDTFLLELSVTATEIESCCETCGDECTAKITQVCRASITDVNDNAPKFGQSLYEGYVREDIYIGTPFTFKIGGADGEIVFPIAEDKDPYDQNFNSFTLEIEDSYKDIFMVSPPQLIGNRTFRVMVNTAGYIDYEDKTEIEFQITAVDDNDDSLTDVTIMKIHVIDVNDCQPEFDEPEGYIVEVFENLFDIQDGFLLRVNAIDKDSSSEFNTASIVYSISEIEDNLQSITIDDRTGKIFIESGAESPFNYEQKTSHTLKVTAVDCNNVGSEFCIPRPVSVDVEINVLNYNDWDPEFVGDPPCTKEFTNTDYKVNAQIIKLEGTDKDGTDIFTFSSSDIPSYFTLSADGSITLHDLLDSNIDSEDEVMGVFDFEVTVKDTVDGVVPAVPGPQRSSTIKCSLTVTDENDESPVFVFPQNDKKYWINVNTEVDTVLKELNKDEKLQLKATDADRNETYSSVTYEWSAGIDPEIQKFLDLLSDGTFRVVKNLTDFPFHNDFVGGVPIKNLMELDVKAKDGGNPPKTTSTLLQIKATKSFPPKFGSNIAIRTFDETNPDEPEQQQQSLPTATDDNNEDRPEDDPDWQDDEICYFLKQNDDVIDIFQIEIETNKLNVIGSTDVDCNTCVQSFELVVAASNICDHPPDDFSVLDSKSLLNVTVTINALNDNVPEFINLPTYYVLQVIDVDDIECKECTIYGRDDDRITPTDLNYNILSVKGSDSSLNFTEGSKFALTPGVDGSSVTISPPTFMNPGGMHGYFDLVIELRDCLNCPDVQTTQTSIKVVVMTGENGVRFGFDNSSLEVCEQKYKIKEVMDKIFQWSFTEKNTLQCNGSTTTRAGEGDITYVEGYFVEQETFQPKTQIDISSKYDWEFDNLYNTLLLAAEIRLDLTRGFQGATHDYGLWTHPEQIAWIIVGSVSGFLVVVTSLFLLTAYCLRTNALERRVKALDTDAMDTDNKEKKPEKFFLSGFTDNVPNSNEFAETGANPIWQAAMETNDYDEEEFKFDDAMSESSGDSIFIGVEDQTEFNDYAEKMKEIEIDMDLYNKVQGTSGYKTLDDYGATDDDDNNGKGTVKSGKNPMYQDSAYL